jgi:hypothetical protein
MRRCPTCNKTYTDETLQFCFDDGTQLFSEPPHDDPQATLVGATPPPSGPGMAYPPNTMPQTPRQTAQQWGSPGSSPGSQATYPAPQRKVWPWVLGCGGAVVIGGSVIVGLIILGTIASNSNSNNNTNGYVSNGSTNSNNKPPVGTVINGTDGQAQLTVPDGWKQQNDLHATAPLQAADKVRELYIIVLSDAKADFGKMTLEQHAQSTLDTFAKKVTDPEIKGPTRLTINGSPALQYELSGTMSNTKVTYLRTTVETKKNFHQIVGWTLQSRIDKNRGELQSVTQSFKETGG